MKILLLTPPMTQLNTPYPATAYLTGFLRKQGFTCVQSDPAITLVMRLFSRSNLKQIYELLSVSDRGNEAPILRFFLAHFEKYLEVVEPTLHFLQGKNPSLALRIVGRDFLPEGPRFRALSEGAQANDPDPIHWAFGSLGVQDRAKYLASLFVDDLADLVREGVDSRFELSRYGEKLAASAPSFEPLQAALRGVPTLVDQILESIVEELILSHEPAVVGLTVPFPGNVYGAFRIAQKIREMRPTVKIVLGGGYVNTELRSLAEPRVFDYVDYIPLDDGERPFLCILEDIRNQSQSAPADSPRDPRLLRTFVRQDGQVVFKTNSERHDIPQRDLGTPTYDGLPLDQYLSIFEMLNPMHRIWSDGRWNKLTLAHGCYWKKCSFCDVSLDYISRYETASATTLVDRIEKIVAETGQTGFHFVDEAAPPKALKALAEELLRRKVHISWWGNIRFEKTFTPELAELLAQSGCIAMSGGLEVASDRLLSLMKKGVSVEQVAQVTKGFSEAGILVHAYLMYGFPTQTLQDTVDALEYVRQLFENGCIQSGFFHRFACTVHSPVGQNPADYGVQVVPLPEVSFAKNDIAFIDPTGTDHDTLGLGLKKAIYNYMHGVGLEEDVRQWFELPKGQCPKSTVPRHKIAKALGD